MMPRISRTGTVLLLALLACKAGEPPVRREDLRAPQLTQALPKPDLQLVQDAGLRFDLRQETRGTLTFLFFGYTHCPDVCPLHMANLAGALRSLPSEVSARVRVIFVTTDPERDTPERLRSWLANFDSTFVGVSGSRAELEAAQRGLGMPVASRDAALPDSAGYTISHGAHLWAFTPDDSAHVVYPLGLQRDDLASDIPKLLRLWPGR
jgi:protein SCO1/2